MRKGYIYIIKNNLNSKVYIGQTIQSVQERFKQHTKPSIVKQRGNYKIYNAINKYGKDNFYVEVLDEAIESKLNELEIYYIEKYNSYEKGYNSTKGADSKTICKIQDLELLKEMFNNGMTYIDMAKHFNVNKVTIQRTLNSIGLKRNNKITKEILLENINLYNYEIALKFGVNDETVSRAFKKYGIKRGRGCNNYKNPQSIKGFKRKKS